MYCMRTSFPISTQLLFLGSNFFGGFSEEDQKNCSVSGPQGPTAPAGPHQLSSFPRKAILSLGMPSESQTSAASVSLGAFLSPLKQVMASFSREILSVLVRNSKVNSIASFFQ